MDDLLKGLEFGVNDYLMTPVDSNELKARVRTQIRQKRYHDRLRHSLRESLNMAVTDGLTGRHNRRYLDSHLANLLQRAGQSGKTLALFMLDIDFFKRVNDTYGHAMGDTVLKEFTARISRNVRGVDLAARYGGEEFVVAMPDTDLETAKTVAERLRAELVAARFDTTDGGSSLSVTASIGVTVTSGLDDTVDSVTKRADGGLYKVKQAGRDQVVSVAP